MAGIPFAMRRFLALPLLVLASLGFAQKPITITVLHTNDMHAHVEPSSIQRKPFGGYARQATLIRKFRATDPNVVVLNGGDTFQGTIYFNVYEGIADVAFMNAVGYQAMAVGNHEFDKGPAALGAFIKQAKFPVLAANLDVSAEPALKGLVKPSTVIEVGGQKLGIVGAITPETPSISSPGENVKFLDLKTSVQAAVDALVAQGINKIGLVSHVGYGGEKQLAREIKGLDFIVGGHSHTLLGKDISPNFPDSSGPYPTVVDNPSGAKCLVVSAWDWGKVLGRMKLHFDAEGRISSWTDAAPIPVDETVAEDLDIASMIAAFRKPIEARKSEVVGKTDTGLTRDSERGYFDSPMANVIADAMLEATKSQGAVAAFTNAGGVRASIEAGPITYDAAISVTPFGNTLVIIDLTGAELKAALEHGAANGGGLLLPSEGTSYAVDSDAPNGSKVSGVRIGGEPLDLSKTYRVCINSFTVAGGDAHETLKNAPGRRVDTGFVDIDALIAYYKANNPLNREPGRRIVRLQR